MRTRRANFLDVAFDVLPVDRLLSRLGAVTSKSAFQYLVTPNVDHMVRLHKSRADLEGLADAYRTADLCVCDSKVLARLARWRGVQLPVVPGRQPGPQLLPGGAVGGAQRAESDEVH
jgi:UDP-N-acetyl-D-mannosaminuronic acid transferase (WecB/TagA/CpsF family)